MHFDHETRSVFGNDWFIKLDKGTGEDFFLYKYIKI